MGPTTWPSCTMPTATCSLAATPIVRILKLAQLIEAVERGGLVAFRQRGVVEDRGYEVVHGPLQRHHRLPDMQQLRRAFTDDMHSENLFCFAMEDKLEPAGGVAADLAARDLAVVGDTDLVGHVFIGELLLCFSDE